MKKEEEILKAHLAKNNLRLTKQREIILRAFLNMESHVSAEELYRETVKKDPAVGLATIYRTISLLCRCGLAQQRDFGDGETRYEHLYNHKHHDHLICTSCGKIAEFENTEIEKLQTKVARNHGFETYSHRLDLYGLCEACKH
ncbi:MAG: transcriptional repressor [Nitrospirota bacterium]